MLQITRDQQTAEDITIETFTKAFLRHSDFVSVSKLKAFLFTTANNAALDYLKQFNARQKVQQDLKALVHGEMEDGELIYIRTEAIKAIHEAIEAIPANRGR